MEDPNNPSPSKKKVSHSDTQVLIFIVLLCFLCAFLLAIAAYGLEKPQTSAKEFDRSKQMLIAAKILTHAGYFEILKDDGTGGRARFDESQKVLVEDPNASRATSEQIKEIAALRIRPLVTDNQGAIFTLDEKNIDLAKYLETHKKSGYAHLPYKLFYAILPNEKESGSFKESDLVKDPSKIYSIVIPVSGFGLWGPIYGYIALSHGGDEVIGTTWYEHAETPGLGANIAEPWWQEQFYGKEVFQQSPSGKTDFKNANLGIVVVKGSVQNVYGTSAKAKSAVDGISGATLTGDGVTAAYRNSLSPYRALLIKLHEQKEEKSSNG